MTAPNSTIRVSAVNSKRPQADPLPEGVKPDHWVDKLGTSFRNPWKSWRDQTRLETLNLIPTALFTFPSPPKNSAEVMPVHKPTWEAQRPEHILPGEEIKSTWLGHACFLVEFPSRHTGGRGVRVLFDPVWSDRCSPSQYMGPKRFTQPPCKIEEIPEVDAVVISHNHYDHLDTATIKALMRRTTRTPHFFAPLGNGPWFKSLGVPTSHTHILDWWDSKRLKIEFSDGQKDASPLEVDITCTPGQHFTGRSLHDHFRTLWAGWVVEEILPKEVAASVGEQSSREAVKVYFAGDTGYRSVMDGQDEEQVPVCPAFKTIGERFGGFDYAMIPIGAYMPRQFMSRIHCAPQDSVRLYQDIRAKKATGMHWGTWILTSEDVKDPPRRLAEECKKAGIPEDDFTTCEIGQTFFF